MATPKKKSNGSWEMQVYVGIDPKTGKKRYKHVTGKSKPDVLAQAKQITDHETPKTLDALSLTVGEAVDRYIAKRESSLSPSTIAKYKNYRASSFNEIMNLKIGQLSDEILQTAVDNYAANHAPKSTVNRWNLILAAVRESKKNFTADVTLPKVPRQRLTMPEEAALLELFSRIENTPLEIPVLLAAVCGMRRSEICALDLAKDIDYEKSIIYVNKALVMNDQKQYVLKDTKTDAGERLIPCPSWVADKLKVARDNPNYRMYKPNTVTTKFKIIAAQLDLKCTFHGLRHYYASIMAALGVPDSYAMERMGHSTDYMLKRYQEYLRFKEVEINRDLMNFFDKLSPSSQIPPTSQ